MAKSIGIHATVSATAAQFIGELSRADNAARRAMDSIQKSVQSTMAGVGRDFALPKLGKGILQGFGIGSGAGLAMAGVDKALDFWREYSTQTEQVSDHIAKIREDQRALRETRFNTFYSNAEDEAKPQLMDKRIKELRDQLDEAALNVHRASRRVAAANEETYGHRVAEFLDQGLLQGKLDTGSASGRAKLALEDQEKFRKEVEALQDKMNAALRERAKVVAGLGEKKLAAEWKEALRQADLAKAGGARSMAEVRGEITPDQEQRAAAIMERVRADQLQTQVRQITDYRGQFARSNVLRVDEATRTGLSNGSDAKARWDSKAGEVFSRMDNTLAKILEELKSQNRDF